MKKSIYSLQHICTVHCSPLQGRHNYQENRKLVRFGRKGKMYHISYDRERKSKVAS